MLRALKIAGKRNLFEILINVFLNFNIDFQGFSIFLLNIGLILLILRNYRMKIITLIR